MFQLFDYIITNYNICLVEIPNKGTRFSKLLNSVSVNASAFHRFCIGNGLSYCFINWELLALRY